MLSGILAWVGARSLLAAGSIAVLLYCISYAILRRKVGWHPFAAG
jgi:hypothetical protein